MACLALQFGQWASKTSSSVTVDELSSSIWSNPEPSFVDCPERWLLAGQKGSLRAAHQKEYASLCRHTLVLNVLNNKVSAQQRPRCGKRQV
jgi:hypothetical protein